MSKRTHKNIDIVADPDIARFFLENSAKDSLSASSTHSFSAEPQEPLTMDFVKPKDWIGKVLLWIPLFKNQITKTGLYKKHVSINRYENVELRNVASIFDGDTMWINPTFTATKHKKIQ